LNVQRPQSGRSVEASPKRDSAPRAIPSQPFTELAQSIPWRCGIKGREAAAALKHPPNGIARLAQSLLNLLLSLLKASHRGLNGIKGREAVSSVEASPKRDSAPRAIPSQNLTLRLGSPSEDPERNHFTG
jgi:hypothetical protein